MTAIDLHECTHRCSPQASRALALRVCAGVSARGGNEPAAQGLYSEAVAERVVKGLCAQGRSVIVIACAVQRNERIAHLGRICIV